MFEIPPLRTAADAAKGAAVLAQAVTEGDLTPGEAAELSRLLEAYAKILEARDFEASLTVLESRSAGCRSRSPGFRRPPRLGQEDVVCVRRRPGNPTWYRPKSPRMGCP
jgi:hypothetical protein